MQLEEFLVRAKISAYAGEGEGGERILEDGCRELTYTEGEFTYRDRYYGWDPFAGEEVVRRGEGTIWAMNYYGRVLTDDVPAAKVYAFLQEAMSRVAVERPFRGPERFTKDGFEYADESHGGVDSFTGVERIRFGGREIYHLYYHGGGVKGK